MPKQYRAYAKVNIFLKITGTRGVYHEILSRFMRVEDLYDELSFVAKSDKEPFVIEGNFDCTTQQNTIYKAYKALDAYCNSTLMRDFFTNHAVVVTKNIPAFAGLGGGSSDAATFLKMCNEAFGFGLSDETLAKLGLEVGADVPFFIYEYASANVRGIGEIVEPFEEETLALDLYTPAVAIATPRVYRAYREHFYHPIEAEYAKELAAMRSDVVLQQLDAKGANDLFAPACKEYPQLLRHYKEGYFFSGSGSTFFKPKEEA